MKTGTWLFVLLLAGCTPYSPPAPDVPQAELVLKSNLEDDLATAKDWSRIWNFFVAFADSGCVQELGTLAGFRGFGSQRGPQETARVAAGRRIYILADSKAATVQGQRETVRNCYNFVSFIPEDGHVYEMHHIDRSPGAYGGANCSTTLHDVTQRQQPKSLMEHPIEGRCAKKFGLP